MMNAFGGMLYLILIVALAGAGYFLYLNLPGEEIGLRISERSNLEGNIKYASSQQFYNNMRFPDSEISYEISSVCDENKRQMVLEAFRILERETVISFKESSFNPGIMIACSELAPEPKFENHFVAGEGGPTEIINTSLYAVILSGKLSLFRDAKCDNANVAIHEILHVLGFDHNENPNSILYPILRCEQTIDSSIIEEINLIYSQESLPDLKIENIEATKEGKYLNFKIEVVNQGLKDAQNVILGVYADENLVNTFDLEEVDIGTKKILSVENVDLKTRSFEKVSFLVDYESKINEIFENNNKIELVLASS